MLDKEVRRAAFELGGFKAPRPDGFSGMFYQRSWEVVGTQICFLVRTFFSSGFNLAQLNWTDLVMIPKVDKPESVGQFRPIGFCNFSYKISKVITNHMKFMMSELITDNQRAFVPRRLIFDNSMKPFTTLTLNRVVNLRWL